MTKLVECIPNYSEGKRPEVVESICRAIASAPGAIVLDNHMDVDHNRSVVTFVCKPENAVEAAFRGYQAALELIDMSQHRGEHPRIGACDVCPFVPLDAMTMNEAVELANNLGRRVGEELKIPVYLYESAARNTARKNLANIRRGQYEELRKTIKLDPDKSPDYGPAEMHDTAGATAIGARLPLVAYNVFLDTSDKSIGQRIASTLRDPKEGLKYVKALAFEIKSRNQIQVSMNLTDFRKTSVFKVFERIKAEAAALGTNVVSSEFVGLVPIDAVAEIVRYYVHLQDFSKEKILEEKLRMAGIQGGIVPESRPET